MSVTESLMAAKAELEEKQQLVTRLENEVMA